MLWEIVGTPHRLLGSAHVLPAETTFPNWVTASYEGIERFVFESGGEEVSGEIGIDRTRSHLKLAGVPEAYQNAKTLLASIEIYDSFDDLLPWAVAFHVVARFLPVLGVFPICGVDYQLRKMAETGKLKIDFLESSNHSSELIDSSCKKANGGLKFLEQTIADFRSGKCHVELRRIVRAWLASDLVDFTAIRDEHLVEFPCLFEPIITQRNQEWGLVAKRFCADESPTLFIVGGLHTVGTGSFIEHLEATGLRLNFIA
jgi:uncharacterized protein YbaP (TraB family)